MSNLYSNINRSMVINEINEKFMFLSDDSRWGLLGSLLRGKWEAGDEVIIAVTDSNKVPTMYDAKHVTRKEISKAVFLGFKK